MPDADRLTQSRPESRLELRRDSRWDSLSLERTAQGARMVLQDSECRRVAVLYLRLYDLTPANSDARRSEVRTELNRALALLTEQLVAYGGTPSAPQNADEGATGLLISAVFGSQTTRENDAERAVRAALEQLERVQSLNRELSIQTIHLQLQMGVHYAQVTTGGDGHIEVQEAALSLARGLALAAPTDHLLISSEVKAVLADLFHYEGLGMIYLKGLSQPLPVYRVAGTNARIEGRWQRSRLVRRSPLVGRERELAFLQQTYRYARLASPPSLEPLPDGTPAPVIRPTMVTLTGPEGCGKSRLLFEFRRITPPFRDGAMAPLVGRAASIFPIPYAIFSEMLRNLFNVRTTDADRVRQRKLESGMVPFLTLEPSLERCIPLFNYLLGGAQESPPQDNARAFQLELRLAFTLLLRTVARQTYANQGEPLLVYLEDLHGIHERSRVALLAVIERLNCPVPLVIFATHRPGFRLPRQLPQFADIQELLLEPLGADSLRQLIRSMLDGTDLPATLEARLLEKASGNPYYLEELVRSLVEERILVQQSGRWELARQAEDVHLPASLSALLMSRLDTLERPVRDLAMRAAVEGELIHTSVMEEVQRELKGPPVGPLLRQLEDARLIRSVELGDDPLYAFENPLVREVSYQTLVPHNRVVLHRLVGQAIENRFASALPDHYLALATHFKLGGESLRAADYYRLAGEKAQQEYANELALSCFTTYLNLSQDSTVSRKVRWHLARILRYLGRADEAAAVLEALSAEILPELEGSHLLLAEVVLELSRVRRNIGQPQDATQLARRALSLFERDHHLRGQADAQVAIGKCQRLMGELENAEHSYQQALTLLEQAGETISAGRVYSNLGRIYLDRRQLDQARRAFEKALQGQTAAHDRWGMALELGHLGETCYMAGIYADAETYFLDCIGQAEPLDIRPLIAGCRMYLGAIAARRGEEKGLELINEAIRIAKALQDLPRKVRGHQLKKEALEALGRTKEAQAEGAIMRAAARDAGMWVAEG